MLASLCGKCCVCSKFLGPADYDAQNVVAAVGPEGTVVCCASHLSEDGPEGPKYRDAVRKVAEAKAAQLKAGQVSQGRNT